MKKKRKIIVILTILLLIAAGTALTVFSMLPARQFVLVQDDGVYFNMTENQLEKIKGTPAEIDQNEAVSSKKCYRYKEQISGYEASVEYWFAKDLFREKLFEVSLLIPNISYENAYELVTLFSERMINEYSGYEDFYETELQLQSNTFISKKFGTDNGAAGISCEIKYENQVFSIQAVNQQ